MSKAAKIWDWPTRMIHWALALCVLANLFVVEDGEAPHRWIGYCAAGLVALRFAWGFLGAKPSRLSSLPVHPRSILAFLRSGLSERLYPDRHNPLASLVYLVLWLLVLSMGLTGWMMGWDRFWGEEWLEELHRYLSIAIEALLVVHALGLLIDSIRYRRHAWLAMITGRRG